LEKERERESDSEAVGSKLSRGSEKRGLKEDAEMDDDDDDDDDEVAAFESAVGIGRDEDAMKGMPDDVGVGVGVKVSVGTKPVLALLCC
jgi:hypothetical protein